MCRVRIHSCPHVSSRRGKVVVGRKLYNTQTTGFLDELVPGGDTFAETAPDVMSLWSRKLQSGGR